MPLRFETRQIGPYKVTSEALPAMRALVLYDQACAFAELRGAELERFTCDMLVMTRVEFSEGEIILESKDEINRVFTGDLKGLLEVLKFVIEVNYGGNFSSGPTESGEGPAKAVSSSTSRKTRISPRRGQRTGSSSRGSSPASRTSTE